MFALITKKLMNSSLLKILLCFTAAALTLMLTACGTLGPKFTQIDVPAKGQSKLYVYRVKRFAGSAWSPDVCLNQQYIGELANGSYIAADVPSGKQQIGLKMMGEVSTSFFLEIAPNQTYFVRMDNSLPQGAKESAENAQLAAIGSTGGALGGALTGGFYGDKAEQARVQEQMDKRAQKISLNPGFLAVNQNFAMAEITETKLSPAPKPGRNPCEPKKAAERR